MPPKRKTPMSGVSMATTTRDDLNRLALEMSVEVGKRVSVSALVGAMLTVVNGHRDELIAALKTPEENADE